MPGSVVDLILFFLIVVFAVNGYRQGFLIGALSFLGFFAGALFGLQMAPLIVAHVESPAMRVLISLASVFGLAMIVQGVTGWAGTRLRRSIHSEGGQRLDNIAGVMVSVVALLLVAWMVAGSLASSSMPVVSRAVRNSAILGTVDDVMPNQARVLYDGLRQTIANGDFPNVFGDLTPTNARDVPAPDPALAKSDVVAAAASSVVKITGTAPSCSRRIEGSGFVYAAGYVMTNAHVVAGTRGTLNVESRAGEASGQVVLYDPQRDLAVIHVPGLSAPALGWATQQAESEESAIVLGYPLDGPFTANSARIRDVRQVKGPNIYEDGTVVREIYTIRSTVRSGNSGGPLISADGTVLGVIFAAAVDDPDTGFALTAAEASGDAAIGARRTHSVGTGACV